MNFYFDTLQEFLWMEGHGPYVWICYGVTIALFIGLALAPGLRQSNFIKQQRALAARYSGANDSGVNSFPPESKKDHTDKHTNKGVKQS